MRLSVAQKIFGISTIVLVLMVVVAAYSIRLTDRISADLHGIARKHLPASLAVTRVNVRVLEQGILLQRLLLAIEAKDKTAIRQEDLDQIRKLDGEVRSEFALARKLLNNEARSSRVHRIDHILLGELDAIEKRYNLFKQDSGRLVRVAESGNFASFTKMDLPLDVHQDALDKLITHLGLQATKLADESVTHADEDENNLLLVSIFLTALATTLAIFFSLLLTRAIVRSVHNLVAGAEQVEKGNFDTEVKVTSRDEVGRLTMSFNHMVEGLRLKERIREMFGKYMDPRIVSNLLDKPDLARTDGERREMTVIFMDLKGFTSISEKLDADDLVFMINSFFTHMADAISRHHGVVDKYMGDAVMAYWGPPFCSEAEHAKLACTAALEALQEFGTFRTFVRAQLGAHADGLELDVRIGIATGEMVVGSIGSTSAKNFTVMGNAVNLGSRLEGANKAYGTHILLSERTRELVGDDLPAREVDLILVKGKHEPSRVYQLAATAQPDLSDALAAYRKQKWDKAAALFGLHPDDTVCQTYLERIALLRQRTLPPDWDSIWVFHSK